ncbi:MAG: helix-turn-helix domain-containing protein [Verrucomicrobiota bacterium]
MHDLDTQKQFVLLRSQGKSYDRIAAELNVSRQTLINWSRKFRFEIQNLQAIERESLEQTVLSAREVHARALGEQLKQVEAELQKRSVADLTTAGLLALASRLRREIRAEIGPLQFAVPISEIPTAEYHELVQQWSI